MHSAARLLAALSLAACATGGYHTGPAATAEIKAVLRSGPGGEAALLAGEDTFLIAPGALVPERRALLGALADKRVYPPLDPEEYVAFTAALSRRDPAALEPFRDRIEPADFARICAQLEAPGPLTATGVKCFHGPRLLEIEYPQGVLRVARVRDPAGHAYRFRVAYGRRLGSRDADVAVFTVAATPALDGAWRGLEAAAGASFDLSVPREGMGPLDFDLLASVRGLDAHHWDGDWVAWGE